MRRTDGFSLVEVVVAMALLGVILLSLSALLAGGVRRAWSGRKMSVATAIAQAVLEQANIYAPQTLLGAAPSDTSATRGWTRDASSTLPAAESEATGDAARRNGWRHLLADADLPASDAHPAVLRVVATPLPAGRTFAEASIVRVTVDLSWYEWGTRPRRVRLETLNLRSEP